VKKFIAVSVVAVSFLVAAPVAQADAVDDAIAALEGISSVPAPEAAPPAPAPEAAPTPAEEHAACVELFGAADCHELECEESFGLDGCPPSGFHSSDDPLPRVPHLGIGEAKGSLRRLFVRDLNGIKLHTRIVGCHRTRRNRVDCTLVLHVRGSSCRSHAYVVETADGYTANVIGFRCRKVGR
jgi:hypothetical protein